MPKKVVDGTWRQRKWTVRQKRQPRSNHTRLKHRLRNDSRIVPFMRNLPSLNAHPCNTHVITWLITKAIAAPFLTKSQAYPYRHTSCSWLLIRCLQGSIANVSCEARRDAIPLEVARCVRCSDSKSAYLYRITILDTTRTLHESKDVNFFQNLFRSNNVTKSFERYEYKITLIFKKSYLIKH